MEVNKAEWNDTHALSGTLADAQMANTAVTPGSYTLASVTIDQKGRITSASNGSAGTVTSVSVTTANGVSGSVATSTTTPAISLTLGAITPSSVVASGSVTGSNLSGTNTGDQDLSSYAPLASPTLTGSPTAPTQAAADNSTKIATTAFIAARFGLSIAMQLYTTY